MIGFAEDYPSPAEGNGLENRQVAVMSCVGSNPTSSLDITVERVSDKPCLGALYLKHQQCHDGVRCLKEDC